MFSRILRDRRIRLILAPDDDVGEIDEESNQCGHHILLSVGFAAPHASGLAFLPAVHAVQPIAVSPAEKIRLLRTKQFSSCGLSGFVAKAVFAGISAGEMAGFASSESVVQARAAPSRKKASVHGAKIKILKS
ncbi:MAG TPA: hypothetical protein VFQ41_01620 [Candidatus Angelobacter sp.]|nr:hypothetical protein [Candidatus Angelobacter sp.]